MAEQRTKKSVVSPASGVVCTRPAAKQPVVHPVVSDSVQFLAKKNMAYRRVISDRVAEHLSSQGADLHDLPAGYNITEMVLMVRDPHWVYAYWDIDDVKKKEIHYITHQHVRPVPTVMRIHDVTNASKADSGRFFDVEVPIDIGQWYVYLGLPEHTFTADLGLIEPCGRFYLITWSNQITMPRDTPSECVDSQWPVPAHSAINEIYRQQTIVKERYPFFKRSSARKKKNETL
jgi:hypothetical protein